MSSNSSFQALSLRDALCNAPLIMAAESAMTVVNGLQQRPHKGANLLGLLSATMLVLEQCGLTPQDMLGMAKNAVNHAEGVRPEFQAVNDFIRHELLS